MEVFGVRAGFRTPGAGTSVISAIPIAGDVAGKGMKWTAKGIVGEFADYGVSRAIKTGATRAAIQYGGGYAGEYVGEKIGGDTGAVIGKLSGSLVGGAANAGLALKNAPKTTGGKCLADNWHQGTFPNRTQSVRYHLGKHGKGRAATQYTRDAMDFFGKNKHLGQNVILKDGTAGIKIQTKVNVPRQKIQRIGGYWTKDGKLVSFWD